jgi:hypothetical protein
MGTDETSWEHVANLANCMAKVEKFHRDNPETLRWGPNDRVKILELEGLTIEVDESDDDENPGTSGSTTPPQPKGRGRPKKGQASTSTTAAAKPKKGYDQHIIYAHWLVDDTDSTSAWKSPTTNELLTLLDKFELYAQDLQPSDPNFAAQQSYIQQIDQLQDDIIVGHWDIVHNNTGHRRYLRKGLAPDKQPQISTSRQKDWLDDLIPNLRSELLAIPQGEQDLPHPRPLVEIGYTSRPAARKKQHATHISSCYAMYLMKAIAIYELDGKYRWTYQPMAVVRSYTEAMALELFFTRLAQSYSWLGGMNTELAGKSITAAGRITTKNNFDLYRDTLKMGVMKENSEKARE